MSEGRDRADAQPAIERHEAGPAADERTWWLDSKENVTRLYRGLWVVCGILVAAEAFVHLHPYFEVEEQYGFYALYGFVAGITVVAVAFVLRRIVMRREDYYDGS